MIATSLQPAGEWDQKEFAFAVLGDLRLNKRLVNVATQLADHPGLFVAGNRAEELVAALLTRREGAFRRRDTPKIAA